MAIKIGGTTVIDDSRNLTNLGSAIAVSQGGTGATDAASARSNLNAINTAGDVVSGNLTATGGRTTFGNGSFINGPIFNMRSAQNSQYINLGSVQSGGSSYIHIKTNLFMGCQSMTMFRLSGFFPYNNYGKGYLGCYAYSGQPSSPYGVLVSNQGTVNCANTMYYSSDAQKYLVLVCYWPTSYNGLLIEYIGAGSYYGQNGPSEVQILAFTGSNSQTGVY